MKNWVNQHRHFGNVVTSRIESIHSILKQYIPSAELDLFEVWVFLNKAVVNQLHELQANQFQQQTRLANDLGNSLYSAVNSWVSRQALRSVENQRLRLNDKNLPDCTYTFTSTMGLPCAHVLKSLREQDKVLHLSHFHTHWHLMCSGRPLFLLEPRRLTDPITARSTIVKSSTRREPSAFEAVEAATEPKAQFRCSRCNTLGHRMNSKKCTLRYSELLSISATSEEPVMEYNQEQKYFHLDK